MSKSKTRETKREWLARMKRKRKAILRMPPDSVCGGCKLQVHSELAEKCWVCFSDLCGPCWDKSGMCNHTDVEAKRSFDRIARAPTVVLDIKQIYPFLIQ